MNYQIDAPGSAIRTTVKLPASKSISNRALILNALSYSAYDVENLSDCDDTNLMVKALNSNDRDFNVGAAGTTMRFLTAFLSKVVGEWTITGTERMKNRPIKVLVDALNALGARIGRQQSGQRGPYHPGNKRFSIAIRLVKFALTLRELNA